MAETRVKQGNPATHPIPGDEMRALRKLQREQDPKSPFVFTSERGSPFTTSGFANFVERTSVEAKLGFKAHPHMLRHACGFALANKGHDTRALQAYLGHRNIQLSSTRCATRSFRPIGSRIFGEAELVASVTVECDSLCYLLLLGVGESRFEHFANRLPRAAVELN
jgi:site-specific recombinase XerC